MNNQTDQVSMLKQAMLERARKLANEHIAQGNISRQNIMQDAREKIQLMEQKELLTAKVLAEREFLRTVQASEIHMQAEMDRNRWGMVLVVMERLNGYLAGLPQDKTQYRAVFIKLLKQASELIAQEQMTAFLNKPDHKNFSAQWKNITSEATRFTITLSDETTDSHGGVRLLSADGTVMVDNTFEGLVSRQEKELQKIIFERLFASVSGTGVISHG
ncbi:MAG: hypothetical protein HKP55_08580 [Gammaproteobacteria bacterium]|nr:hypothetical protein [Gammaproteobacteria bacterium]NNJ91715.1 hypothetical protein [Gammaproteobacteria bacterium]